MEALFPPESLREAWALSGMGNRDMPLAGITTALGLRASAPVFANSFTHTCCRCSLSPVYPYIPIPPSAWRTSALNRGGSTFQKVATFADFSCLVRKNNGH